jgi:hypothetical protein
MRNVWRCGQDGSRKRSAIRNAEPAAAESSVCSGHGNPAPEPRGHQGPRHGPGRRVLHRRDGHGASPTRSTTASSSSAGTRRTTTRWRSGTTPGSESTGSRSRSRRRTTSTTSSTGSRPTATRCTGSPGVRRSARASRSVSPPPPATRWNSSTRSRRSARKVGKLNPAYRIDRAQGHRPAAYGPPARQRRGGGRGHQVLHGRARLPPHRAAPRLRGPPDRHLDGALPLVPTTSPSSRDPTAPSTTSPSGSTTGTTSARPPTSSPTTPSWSTSGPTRHGVTRGNTIYFFDPMGTRNEVFTGGYRPDPDFPTITWTEDNIGKAVFYYEGEINDRFMKVSTPDKERRHGCTATLSSRDPGPGSADGADSPPPTTPRCRSGRLLETARDGDRVWLKCWDELQHHSVILTYAPTYGLNHSASRCSTGRTSTSSRAGSLPPGSTCKRLAAGELGPGSAARPSGSVAERAHHRAGVRDGAGGQPAAAAQPAARAAGTGRHSPAPHRPHLPHV